MSLFTRAPSDRFVGRFALLVGVCLLDYVLLVVASDRFIGLFVVLPILATVILARRASRIAGPSHVVGVAASGLAGLIAIYVSFKPNQDFTGAEAALLAVSLICAFIVVFARIMSDSGATLQSVFAALSCYLLVGLIFALADLAIGSWSATFFAQPGSHPVSDYAYFSFVTMTTVGYGDLTPGIAFARSMAVLEAVIGQMILVTLVARTVASASASDWRRRQGSDD